MEDLLDPLRGEGVPDPQRLSQLCLLLLVGARAARAPVPSPPLLLVLLLSSLDQRRQAARLPRPFQR